MTCVASVRLGVRDHLSDSDLRAGLALVSGVEAERALDALVPASAPSSVPTREGGQRACYARRDALATRPLATVSLRGETLVPSGLRTAAERDLARRESTAYVGRLARAEASAEASAYWHDHSAYTCKGSPRSGIRGRLCPESQHDIRQWSAVTRDARPTTANDAGRAGVSVLAQDVSATATGGAVVTRTRLASVNGQMVAETEKITLTPSGGLRTRGKRGGSARRRRGKRRVRSTPVVEYK